MHRNTCRFILFSFTLLAFKLHCSVTPEPIGNFALKTSQRVSPLFSLGQNIVDKGDFLTYGEYVRIKGENFAANDGVLSFLYGFTNKCSIIGVFPVTSNSNPAAVKTAGIADLFIQVEYEYYEQNYTDASNSCTALCALYLPRGTIETSFNSIPAEPFGILFGGTVSHESETWYAFLSGGAIVRPNRKKNNTGNSILYQCGIGANLEGITNKFIACVLFEINGNYTTPCTTYIQDNLTSGGNFVFAAPSIYLATEKVLFQCGVGIPICENLCGPQSKTNYLFITNFAWKF